MDVKQVYTTKVENFVDFGDVYLSFIFNLLANSLQIKVGVENMIKATDKYDTDLMMKNLGSILRIVADFDSYQTQASARLPFHERRAIAAHKEAVQRPIRHKARMERRKVRLAEINHIETPTIDLNIAMQSFAADGKNGKKRVYSEVWESAMGDIVVPKRRLEGLYEWTAFDGVQSPLAILIGGLNVLSKTSNGGACSSATTTGRTEIKQAIQFYNSSDDLEGFTSVHKAMSNLDDMGLNCYYAFINDLNEAYFTKLFSTWWEIPVNLLYNAGAMWTDAVNYMFYTPETCPSKDWGFFFFYLTGDFALRVFVRNEDPSADANN